MSAPVVDSPAAARIRAALEEALAEALSAAMALEDALAEALRGREEMEGGLRAILGADHETTEAAARRVVQERDNAVRQWCGEVAQLKSELARTRAQRDEARTSLGLADRQSEDAAHALDEGRCFYCGGAASRGRRGPAEAPRG